MHAEFSNCFELCKLNTNKSPNLQVVFFPSFSVKKKKKGRNPAEVKTRTLAYILFKILCKNKTQRRLSS